MTLQRLHSNGNYPSVASLATAQRAALVAPLVALGAVGLSLGAAWAWQAKQRMPLLDDRAEEEGAEGEGALSAPRPRIP